MNSEHSNFHRECALPLCHDEAVEPKYTTTYNAGQQNNAWKKEEEKGNTSISAHSTDCMTAKKKQERLAELKHSHTCREQASEQEKSERWRKRRARKYVVLKKFCLECVPLVLVTRNNISIQLNAEILLCIWHIHSLKIAHWNDVVQSEIVYKSVYTLMCHIGDDTMTAAILGWDIHIHIFRVLENKVREGETTTGWKLKQADLNTVRFSRFHFTC